MKDGRNLIERSYRIVRTINIRRGSLKLFNRLNFISVVHAVRKL